MKTNNVIKLTLSKFLKHWVLISLLICTVFAICLSSIGIATANNLGEDEQPNTQEINPNKSYSDQSYYLGFTAVGVNSQVAINAVDGLGFLPERNFYYSNDNCNTWIKYEVGINIDITANSTVYFKGDNPEGLSLNQYDYYYFSFKKETRINVSGCVLSLLGEEVTTQGIPPTADYCFNYLFKNCKEITNISDNLLESSTLSIGCYWAIFISCTGLSSIPEGLLPVKNLTDECYNQMFSGCTGLNSIPEGLLPADDLSGGCYSYMFEGCTNLTEIPVGLLHSHKLASSCYSSMFQDCSGLLSIPKKLLPAEEAVRMCYQGMFVGCTSLTQIPENFLPSIKLGEYCYQNMFGGCTGLKSIPETLLPSNELVYYCYGFMFSGCSGLKSIPERLLPSKTLADFCYQQMFDGCAGLTSLPEGLLHAKELTEGCYYGIFSNCTSLSSLPVGLLPAEELATDCYCGMFSGCIGLNNIPEGLLPAEELSENCYARMFFGCSGITKIPEGFLHAEELDDSCYAYMFSECTDLTSIPEGLLPAKELALYSYAYMFAECKNLEKGPNLPATTLKDNCYSYMFENCENLNYVKADFTEWQDGCMVNWLSGVSPNGTFLCKNKLSQPNDRSASTIPSTWKIIPESYMTYLTDGNSATLSYSLNFSTAKNCVLYYSKDFISWSAINVSSPVTKKTIETFNNVEKLYMYGFNPDGINTEDFIINFTCDEKFQIDGSIMDLLSSGEDTIPNAYCFNSLYEGCTGLVQGPSLPATNLKEYCYLKMFKDCISLTKGLDLPASELKDSCYMEMFNGCKNLVYLKVAFSDWLDDTGHITTFDNLPTRNWLLNTDSADESVKYFYCPVELDMPSRDADHVPQDKWNIKQETVINAELTGVNIHYDAQVHSIQVNVTTIGEFVPQYKYGDDDWKTTNYEFSEVGTYTVFVKIEKENYQTFEGSADVVINKNTEGQLSIVDCTKTYGDDDPNFAVQSSGFVGGYIPAEGRDFVVFRDKGEDVKPGGEWYTIHAYWINNNSNFEIPPAEGKMTITKANATLVAEEKSKLDNAEDPTFTAHMNGLVHGGDVLNASHYTITKQQNADGSISLSPALTAEGQQAFLGNYNVTYESALLKTYTNDEKVIVVPEYINVPGESSETGIAQTQINNSNEENKEKTAFGKTNSDNDNEFANGTNLALTLSLIANGLLIAFGIILFLKFKTRIFK